MKKEEGVLQQAGRAMVRMCRVKLNEMKCSMELTSMQGLSEDIGKEVKIAVV